MRAAPCPPWPGPCGSSRAARSAAAASGCRGSTSTTRSGLILFALDRADVAGPLNATSPEPSRQGEFVKALGHALRRPAVVPTPAVALRLALGEMATLVLDGQRAVPRAALAAGYAFRYPDLDGALRAIYG